MRCDGRTSSTHPACWSRTISSILALVNGQVTNPEQLSQIVIKTTPAGVPVRVGDVAAVGPGVKPVYTVVTANGKPAIC